jgi:very-short-patch-repair endonuclease
MVDLEIPVSFTYSELRGAGWSRRAIESAVRAGRILRVRKGTYVGASCGEDVIAAARAGGRLDCLSFLARLGVFVMRSSGLHVQVDYGTPRIRRADGVGLVRHWRVTSAARRHLVADLTEALAQACRCQAPRAAIATLDSAWHLGLVDDAAIADVFALLPRRFGALRALLDSRSESGIETLVRLMLRMQGWPVDVQVSIGGVGRVDLLVDGWLIVECDSKAFHEGWATQRDDRRRDAAAAALGYTTLRVLAEDVLFAPERIIEAARGLIESRAAASLVHNVASSRRRRR